MSILIYSAPLWSYPTVSGFSDTSVYVYSSERDDLGGTQTKARIHEGVMLNVDFMKQLSFHTFNRITVRTDTNENPDMWDLNIYYGYLEYDFSKDLIFQFGRIMDISNLAFTFYDGVNLEYKLKFSNHKANLFTYVGFVVNDDYLEHENSIHDFSSFDYRSLFTKQRNGDYTTGAKANIFLNKLGIIALDYQVLFNENKLAEQYVNFNFDTFFSKMIRAYGYVNIDTIDNLPSNSHIAVRINPLDKFSYIFEYEYSRPVFLKDSFFWAYFIPYGAHSLNNIFLYIINKDMTVDFQYSALLYDATDESGHEISTKFIHRDIFDFTLKFYFGFLTGPEGHKIKTQVFGARRIWIIDAIAGFGAVFYSDDEELNSFSQSYYLSLGARSRIMKSLVLSFNSEFYANPKYYYDTRMVFSVKYLF
ncbi:hypothetical protein ACFL20_04220 [Spirochaetota bacterium]